MTTRQFDAHVRARKPLAMKVISRRREWGLGSQVKRLTKGDTSDEALLPIAYAAIALHSAPSGTKGRSNWREGWGNKLSRYSPFGEPQKVVGTFTDVPANVVHSIMCRMGDTARPEPERAPVPPSEPERTEVCVVSASPEPESFSSAELAALLEALEYHCDAMREQRDDPTQRNVAAHLTRRLADAEALRAKLGLLIEGPE